MKLLFRAICRSGCCLPLFYRTVALLLVLTSLCTNNCIIDCLDCINRIQCFDFVDDGNGHSYVVTGHTLPSLSAASLISRKSAGNSDEASPWETLLLNRSNIR